MIGWSQSLRFSVLAVISILSGVSAPTLVASGDKLLTTRTIGQIAATARKPQPTHWTIATDGSASPSSVEQPASAGWGFVVDRVGLLAGVEVECWGEVVTDDRDPRALGADSLSNNSGELWAWPRLFFG